MHECPPIRAAPRLVNSIIPAPGSLDRVLLALDVEVLRIFL